MEIFTEFELLRRIKRIAITALISNDKLFEMLVLKGGSVIEFFYPVSPRPSLDIDFSIESEIDIKSISPIILDIFNSTFEENGFKVFDIKVSSKPNNLSQKLSKFWGGYKIEFKVIDIEKYKDISNSQEQVRRESIVIGHNQKRKFTIDISKYEYVAPKVREEIDGYSIYIYSPVMVVIEKLRAVCQQLPEYKKIVPTQTFSPRAKDFFDIYMLMDRYAIDLFSAENKVIFKEMFNIKRVPLKFLSLLETTLEFHRLGYVLLQNTLPPEFELKEFDFYFEFVINSINKLESLRIE